MIEMIYHNGRWVSHHEIDWFKVHRAIAVFGFVFFQTGVLL